MIRVALLVIVLTAVFGCGNGGALQTPDVPAAVDAASEAVVPASTPNRAPDIEATIEVQPQATVAALPTATAAPVPTATPTPMHPLTPTSTLVPIATPTRVAAEILIPTRTSTPVPVPPPSATLAPSAGTTPLASMAVRRMFPGLNFRHLTNLVQPDDGRDRIFVTQQGGLVRVFPNEQQAPEAAIFLDISGRVSEEGNEEGLLGLAFDPRFAENGFFYVYYSAGGPRRSVVSRFSQSQDNPEVASPHSELVLLEVEQPFSNHNGGQLAFGPDGFLYIGLGDGGLAADPMGNGQNRGTLLGSILRLDVAGATENSRYRTPADNPFVGQPGARPEIWAYGLRNPWRFSFDTATGRLWAGDVGQNLWEEIDLIGKGLNYGWNTMEGFHCFSPQTACDDTGLELPVVEYPNGADCSVTGGHVYRGARLAALYGAYIYADYCSGKIWGLRQNGESVTEHRLLVHSDVKEITSFGEDLAGNIYILSRNEGIYQLEAAP